ncbi:hypothetical protein [Hanstruepera marina]|uniref:hypothetical protein n=1 Tax=Hanstruepera marina TaxID=2873265 RepID=UPI001CA629A2|nr:hypothetical protein [Hanstruepera marina]
MSKKTIAILFSILFLAFITAPTIIIAVDDSVDVSIFYSVTEEENENLKLAFTDNNFESENISIEVVQENSRYFFKKYQKPHLNLVSPPPELSIL